LLIAQQYKHARNFYVGYMESAGEKPRIMPPNNQLHTEKSGGHCTSFVAMFHLLHSIKDE